jgi:hypothetical protein
MLISRWNILYWSVHFQFVKYQFNSLIIPLLFSSLLFSFLFLILIEWFYQATFNSVYLPESHAICKSLINMDLHDLQTRLTTNDYSFWQHAGWVIHIFWSWVNGCDHFHIMKRIIWFLIGLKLSWWIFCNNL